MDISVHHRLLNISHYRPKDHQVILQKVKHLIRNNPTLFRLLWKRHESPDYKRRVVRPNDELVIEGFPRSGNTFALYAFQNAQKTCLKIGNHFHSPAQFLLAKKYNIPAVLLIRNPKDAVVSLAIYQGNSDIEKLLSSYISFHDPLLKIKSSFVTAVFEEVINNMGGITNRINERFGTDFTVPDLTPDYSSKVLARIEEDRQKRLKINQDYDSSELRRTTPSDKKNELKQGVLLKMESPKYAELLRKANDIYNSFIK